MPDDFSSDAIDLATELTAAWLSNSNTRTDAEGALAFFTTMRTAMQGTGNSNADTIAHEEFTPAVSVRKSLASRDHIISMIDGKPYKTLTRHLSTHGLTAAQYRERYGLKADYPTTAPAYSEKRREMAKKIGLGRKPGQTGNKR